MITSIVFLPLLGAIVAGFFGPFLGARASEVITCLFMILAAVFSWIVFGGVFFGAGETIRIELLPWIVSGSLDIRWVIRVDTLTAVMLVVVNTVSALVHVYSVGYMHDDPDRPRFFSYLSLFTFTMLMLVTADNFLQMFFGWEGVGLASYLLIGFWFKKPSANAAAMKAFIVNRVGDFGFILGVIGVFLLFGTLDFDQVFGAVKGNEVINGTPVHDLTVNWFGIEWHAITIVCLLLFMGAMGKSAQFLLHTWLPDAMEGPTPVSALIHAATMVTAGVFLVCRCSPLFEYSETALAVVTIFGAVTCLFAATIGLAQNDIKRVIAYSTCSQLGYMFFAAGVSAYQAAMFHLFTHAFFKALLFLCAGSVIHALHHEQDMRKMGGMVKVTTLTWFFMLVGTLAITGVGIPHLIGFAGFYSKDAIIESAFAAGTNVGSIAFVFGVVAALLTSIYSWRLMFMTFHGPHNMSEGVLKKAHESPPVMLVPLGLLTAGALFSGIAFYTFFVGDKEQAFWGESIYVLGADHHGAGHGAKDAGHANAGHGVADNSHDSHDTAADGAHGAAAGHGATDAAHGATSDKPKAHTALHDRHYVPEWVLWAPFVVTWLGFAISYYFYILRRDIPTRMGQNPGPIHRAVQNKWYFDEIYDFIFVRPAMWIGRLLWKGGDGKIIDGMGPDGISARVVDGTNLLVRFQSGYLYTYAFVMLIGVSAAVTYFIWQGA